MASGKKLVLRRRPMTGLASSAVTVSRRAFLGLASLGTSILSLAGALPRLRALPGAQPPGAAPSGHGDRRRAATLVLSEQSPRQPVRYGRRGRESHPPGCARPLSTPQRRSPPRRWGAAEIGRASCRERV